MGILFLFGIVSTVFGACEGIASNLCAKVYEHARCDGEVRQVNRENTNWVGSHWNDKVSSIIVNEAADCKISIYEHSNYQGHAKRFTSTEENLQNIKMSGWWIFSKYWNDKTSSWKCTCG